MRTASPCHRASGRRPRCGVGVVAGDAGDAGVEGVTAASGRRPHCGYNYLAIRSERYLKSPTPTGVGLIVVAARAEAVRIVESHYGPS